MWVERKSERSLAARSVKTLGNRFTVSVGQAMAGARND